MSTTMEFHKVIGRPYRCPPAKKTFFEINYVYTSAAVSVCVGGADISCPRTPVTFQHSPRHSLTASALGIYKCTCTCKLHKLVLWRVRSSSADKSSGRSGSVAVVLMNSSQKSGTVFRSATNFEFIANSISILWLDGCATCILAIASQVGVNTSLGVLGLLMSMCTICAGGTYIHVISIANDSCIIFQSAHT